MQDFTLFFRVSLFLSTFCKSTFHPNRRSVMMLMKKQRQTPIAQPVWNRYVICALVQKFYSYTTSVYYVPVLDAYALGGRKNKITTISCEHALAQLEKNKDQNVYIGNFHQTQKLHIRLSAILNVVTIAYFERDSWTTNESEWKLNLLVFIFRRYGYLSGQLKIFFYEQNVRKNRKRKHAINIIFLNLRHNKIVSNPICVVYRSKRRVYGRVKLGAL